MARNPQSLALYLRKYGVHVKGIELEDELTDAAIYLDDVHHIQLANTCLMLWKDEGKTHRILYTTVRRDEMLDAIKKYVDMPKSSRYKANEGENDNHNTTEDIMTKQITTKEMLTQLNHLRDILGMAPLKAWKESRAKLEAKIKELEAKADEDDLDKPEDELEEEARLADQEAEESVDETPAPAKDEKDTEKAPRTPKKRGASKAERDTVSLADIARECNVRPQTARAKFRRILKRDDNAPQPLESGKWDFNASDKKRLVELLKG